MLKLGQAPIVAYQHFEVPFTQETDASKLGLYRSSLVIESACHLHPVAFARLSLSNVDKNCSITQLETCTCSRMGCFSISRLFV